MTSMPFTLDGYAGIVTDLLNAGYSARGYGDADPARTDLILRHDVDMDLGRAVEMAEVEAKLGVRAVYFVLLRTEFYNVFSGRGRQLLRQIAASGAGVGLHFDASLYEDDADILDRAAAKEARILAEALGTSLEAVSYHRPAKSLIGGRTHLGGLISAYAPRFISEMGYCSDSRGGWHHGPPWSHPAVASRRALHLLTHPIWWAGRNDTPEARLDHFVSERQLFLDDELQRNCVIYTPRHMR
jgi:hypothetical protein